MSTVLIWWCKFFAITIYSGHFVYNVHNFHVVLLGLHLVAPGMKQGKATELGNRMAVRMQNWQAEHTS